VIKIISIFNIIKKDLNMKPDFYPLHHKLNGLIMHSLIKVQPRFTSRWNGLVQTRTDGLVQNQIIHITQFFLI